MTTSNMQQQIINTGDQYALALDDTLPTPYLPLLPARTDRRKMRAPRRLPSQTFNMLLQTGNGVHNLDISIAYHPETGCPQEVVFVTRGKIGQAMDHLLSDIGIGVSRALQNRDPNTGEIQ